MLLAVFDCTVDEGVTFHTTHRWLAELACEFLLWVTGRMYDWGYVTDKSEGWL